VTPTPLSRSKDQRSTCRGRGILWRPPAQHVIIINIIITIFIIVNIIMTMMAINVLSANYANTHSSSCGGRIVKSRLYLAFTLNLIVLSAVSNRDPSTLKWTGRSYGFLMMFSWIRNVFVIVPPLPLPLPLLGRTTMDGVTASSDPRRIRQTNQRRRYSEGAEN